MTVADNTSRNQYTATSGQTVFAYTFEIVDKDDIVVLKNGTTLSEGTDYTVSNVGNDNGGNVTLTVGATTGDILTLYRDMPYVRTQNYTNAGDFLASEVNSDFDNLWLAGEQTNRSFSQSIRKPITDSDSISMELPEAADRAGKYLQFDNDGAVAVTPGGAASSLSRQQFTGDGSTTAFTLSTAPDAAGAGLQIYIDGVYQEAATYSVSGSTLTFTEAPPTNASIEVITLQTTAIGTTTANAVSITDSGNYYTSNNVEGALQETAQSQNIVYTPAGTGAVQTTVQTKLRESVSVKDFGAVGDGVTDDTAAIQAALDSFSGDGAVYIPAGDYKISAKISIPSNIVMFGDSYISRIFRDVSVTPFDMLEIKNKSGIVLKDFQIDGVTKLDVSVASNRYCGIRIHAEGGTRPNNIEIIGVHVNATTSGEKQSEGNRGAILIEDSYDIRIRQCKFYNNRATAILLTIQTGTSGINTEEIQIEQCWAFGEIAPFDAAYPSGFGSFISGDNHQDVMISGCYCDDFGFSNISVNGPRSTVQNCISLNSDFAGINVGHTTAGSNADDSVIQGNICKGNSYEGIIAAGSKNLVIDGNICRDNSQDSGRNEIRILHDGNYDAGETKKIIISNNQLLESNGTGVQVGCGTDIFFTGNLIGNSAFGGIFVRQNESSETMNIYITNNHFHDNGGDNAAIEVNSSSGSGHGQVNAVCMNNIVDSSDATTIQQLGIMAVGDNADIQVHDNWYSSTYSGTGVNTNYGARSAKPLNAFSSGSIINANIKNA